MLAPPDPPLTDGVVLLRTSTRADVQAIRAVYSEPDIRLWMGWDAEAPDQAEAEANVERAAQAWREGTWAVFRIVETRSEELVSGVNLRVGEHAIGEVSYFLRASARGRGLATRAVRLVSRWAFAELGIERLELRTHADNVASQRVAERAGFRRERDRAGVAGVAGRFTVRLNRLLAASRRPALRTSRPAPLVGAVMSASCQTRCRLSRKRRARAEAWCQTRCRSSRRGPVGTQPPSAVAHAFDRSRQGDRGRLGARRRR